MMFRKPTLTLIYTGTKSRTTCTQLAFVTALQVFLPTKTLSEYLGQILKSETSAQNTFLPISHQTGKNLVVFINL
ncbi:hypothetical protein EZMO1_4287 [Endozoicomonas montiporae CL-33]|uniref:Uncharacterized protein n=1 Tax=Endozoicomonas montiporae CL-33 TaxID=570277 RepID=A0A142BHH9_9GAMM|nr:hypothetical protein EZMO1_4287 [Endozoicomonas montiporae CL-33]